MYFLSSILLYIFSVAKTFYWDLFQFVFNWDKNFWRSKILKFLNLFIEWWLPSKGLRPSFGPHLKTSTIGKYFIAFLKGNIIIIKVEGIQSEGNSSAQPIEIALHSTLYTLKLSLLSNLREHLHYWSAHQKSLGTIGTICFWLSSECFSRTISPLLSPLSFSLSLYRLIGCCCELCSRTYP